MKTLNLVSKIVNEKFASSKLLSYIIMKTKPNKIQILNENGDKQSQNTRVEVTIFARQKSALGVGFGLFRIIFTLPKLKQKELALNSADILQLK